MDLKAIVNTAFKETYRPLTEWQRYVIQEAVDLAARINSEEGFICSLGNGYSSPISYYEHENEGEKRNRASVRFNITYQNQPVSISVDFTEILRNGTRKANCSLGNSFEKKSEIDLSHPDAMTDLLREVAKECGRKMAEDMMSRQLADSIAAQRLLSSESYGILSPDV